MQDVPSLSPLLQYTPLPLFIALGLLVAVGTWYGLVFWLTRRKQQKVLATLPPSAPVAIDTSALKSSYLHLIDVVEEHYRARELKARGVHQELSMLLRRFVSEAGHVPTSTMTLSDLKKTRFTELATTIESYYKPEFAAVENGTVDNALAAARKVVSEWS